MMAETARLLDLGVPLPVNMARNTVTPLRSFAGVLNAVIEKPVEESGDFIQ